MTPDEVTDEEADAGPRLVSGHARLKSGAVVEVMNPFTGEWRNGFVVLAGDDLGYVLGREDSPGVRTAPIPRQRLRSAHPGG